MRLFFIRDKFHDKSNSPDKLDTFIALIFLFFPYIYLYLLLFMLDLWVPL